MSESRYQHKLNSLFDKAGIAINGDLPGDIQVKDPRLYARVFSQGSLGLGEAYMDGWWECPQLDVFFYKLLRSRLDEAVHPLGLHFRQLCKRLLNLQSRTRAFIVGEHHYDLGNELYEHFLDPLMIYSCGYWRNAENLAQAQEAKLDLCCRKLKLERGMRLLDIGCGWGGLAYFAAKHYGVAVTGVTVSREQCTYAQDLCGGLPVDILLQDYRSIRDRYDRIISIGMFEHVGIKNYKTFMRTVKNCLQPDGLFLLHTIGQNRPNFAPDPWITRYIFPNSMLPAPSQILRHAEKRFVMEDWHNFGPDYDRTLMQWLRNFQEAWPSLSNSHSRRFYRMWTYYLASCAGAFRARTIQLWQIVFSPKGELKGYHSQR